MYSVFAYAYAIRKQGRPQETVHLGMISGIEGFVRCRRLQKLSVVLEHFQGVYLPYIEGHLRFINVKRACIVVNVAFSIYVHVYL